MSWLNKFFKFREKSDGDVVKPFLEHMEDLRWMIIKCAGVLICSMILSFFWVRDLKRLITAPLAAIDPKAAEGLVAFGIPEALTISIHLAFFAGIVIALPFILYFVIGFVIPALTRQERKFLFPGIAGSTLLFAAGVLVSYYYILPTTLVFFKHYADSMEIRTLWTWSAYLSFCTWLTIGFGLLCQLPVVVVALSFIGLVNFTFLSRTRPYAVTIILILAAIIAPTPDPMTFLTLGAPVVLLYEACIWIVWLLDRRKLRREREEQDRLASGEA
jgi:sec-independent protein translocase protein TatC